MCRLDDEHEASKNNVSPIFLFLLLCSVAAEVQKQQPLTRSTSLAAGWLHIFQISQRTSAGGDHDGRHKYSTDTCCIPSALILLTFPHGGPNRLSFNLI